MFDTTTLNPSEVTFDRFDTPGVKKTDRLIVNLSSIYVPAIKDNPVRKKGKDVVHIQKLVECFKDGISYSRCPPILTRQVRQMDGVIYEYELVCGNHRLEAFKNLGFEEWIFDVYEIPSNSNVSYEDAIRTLQLAENNHEAQLPSTEDDVVNIICRLINRNSKLIAPEEDSIREYVDTYCSNMHHKTKSKVVCDVVRRLQKNGIAVYSDVVTYTASDVVDFVNKKTDLVTQGEYDDARNKYGWSVLEGYEYEYVMNAAKKFAETGRTSYFVCHTKSPTEKFPIDIKRQKMAGQFSKLEKDLIQVFKYHQKTGKFPWEICGFLPQNVKAGEKEFIEV